MGQGMGVMNWEMGIDACALTCVKQIHGGACCEVQGAQLTFSDDLDGWDGGEVGLEVQEGGGTHTHTQLIHFVIQHWKAAILQFKKIPFVTQHWKATILQLKKKNTCTQNKCNFHEILKKS